MIYQYSACQFEQFVLIGLLLKLVIFELELSINGKCMRKVKEEASLLMMIACPLMIVIITVDSQLNEWLREETD